MTHHSPEDIAEKVLAALVAQGYMDPRVFMMGDEAPDGAPFILVRTEGSDQVWRLKIEGPQYATTPETIAEAAVAFGFADPDPEDQRDTAPTVTAQQYTDRTSGPPRPVDEPNPRPCTQDGCGRPMGDHIGWALRHLYAEPKGD